MNENWDGMFQSHEMHKIAFSTQGKRKWSKQELLHPKCDSKQMRQIGIHSKHQYKR